MRGVCVWGGGVIAPRGLTVAAIIKPHRVPAVKRRDELAYDSQQGSDVKHPKNNNRKDENEDEGKKSQQKKTGKEHKHPAKQKGKKGCCLSDAAQAKRKQA